MKATERPWYIRYFRPESPLDGFFIEAKKTNPKAGYNIEIMADQTDENYPDEQKLADAELIVRAVNNHDELLAALEASRVTIKAFLPDAWATINAIESAIQKAKS